MLLFYIRHGDPIYIPDSLTPLGERQAEAVAKRLALYGIDEVYSSTSNRAILTSNPTCEILKKKATLLDFTNEHHAWEEMTVERNGVKNWIFHDVPTRKILTSSDILSLGHEWYKHPEFTGYEKGIKRIYDGTDEFLKSLGYEHNRYTGTYNVLHDNQKRVALFAHQGFGLMFFSCMMDIPLPVFTTHFDTCHTGMTVIEFKEEDGICLPRMLMLSSDSHIYREGLPTNYNNELRF